MANERSDPSLLAARGGDSEGEAPGDGALGAAPTGAS